VESVVIVAWARGSGWSQRVAGECFGSMFNPW
jgi:hypothetical protein